MSKLWNDAKGNVTFVFVCIITFIAVVLLAKLLEKLVMKNGRMMEYGPAAAVLESPVNEYTKTLLASVPRLRR